MEMPKYSPFKDKAGKNTAANRRTHKGKKQTMNKVEIITTIFPMLTLRL
jgi:hypothetical protein